jgi:hypothetical protein
VTNPQTMRDDKQEKSGINFRDVLRNLPPETIKMIIADLDRAIQREWIGSIGPSESVYDVREFCAAYLMDVWPDEFSRG